MIITRHKKGSQKQSKKPSQITGQSLIILLVPVLLFVFMLFRLAELHFFYQEWYDPLYAYLMNGLTFALGSCDIGLTEHPGTPLQLFCAVIIKISSLVRGISSDNLADDVIGNPELYLRIISFSLIVINCAFLWMLGYFALKRFDNRPMAVLLQLLPLLSFELVKYLPIVCCESVVIVSSFALVSCLIWYDSSQKNHTLLLVLIALFSALSVATKISSLVILIIPFFFLKGIKPKIIYTFLTLLFIFVFISPVVSKLGHFFNFLKGIATHSGKYGSGQETLIDWGIFFQSMYKIVTKEVVFTTHLIFLLAGWFTLFKRKVKGSLLRLYTGITLATLIQIIIVSRHYGFHYLMPLLALALPMHGYFWLSLFREKIITWPARKANLTIIIVIPTVFLSMIIRNDFNKGIVSPVEDTAQHISADMKIPFVVLTEGNSGGAFIDPAFHFGLGYSGGTIRQFYTKIVDKYYNGNYSWNSHDGFCDWKSTYLPSELISKFGKLYFYERNLNGTPPMSQINSMVNQTGISGYLTLEMAYNNKVTHETIALAKIDTSLARNQMMPLFVVKTGIELLAIDGDKIVSDDGNYLFSGGKLMSKKYAHSGEKSVLLTSSSPYGLNISISTSTGPRYKAEIWQKTTGLGKALIVASSKVNGLLYKTSFSTDDKNGEWTKSELIFTIPENYPEKEVNFYIWNPTKDSIWIDDFSIAVFP